jgi:hypothetical protein
MIRRTVFSVGLAICLIRPAIALVVELPRKLASVGSADAVRRPIYLDAVRGQAPDGNVLLSFDLPPGAEDVAAFLYYQLVYDLHPRRVFVTDEPAVIDDGRDLLRVSRMPDPAWLSEHGVAWRVDFGAADGALRVAVHPLRTR